MTESRLQMKAKAMMADQNCKMILNIVLALVSLGQRLKSTPILSQHQEKSKSLQSNSRKPVLFLQLHFLHHFVVFSASNVWFMKSLGLETQLNVNTTLDVLGYQKGKTQSYIQVTFNLLVGNRCLDQGRNASFFH